MGNTRIAIVYHSGYGHTGRQAEAVKYGVEQVEGAEALLLTVEEAQRRRDDLASAAFKEFQEATSHAVFAKGFAWKDKIAAGFTNSGSRSGDKLAILVTEDDSQGGVDQVDSHRTILLVVSPYARKNYVSHVNASFPGLLKTMFRLLRIPPLNLYGSTG